MNQDSTHYEDLGPGFEQNLGRSCVVHTDRMFPSRLHANVQFLEAGS